MAGELVLVPFSGDTLEAVQDEKGDVWVSLRRVCESLGVAEHRQQSKLKAKTWACTNIMLVHDTTGRQQEAYMLHLDSVPMWLATIEPSRVSEAVRPKLEKYQKECARVLRDHFFGVAKAQTPTVAELLPVLLPDVLRELAPVVGQMVAECLRAEFPNGFPLSAHPSVVGVIFDISDSLWRAGGVRDRAGVRRRWRSDL